jgi:hypothetical protein
VNWSLNLFGMVLFCFFFVFFFEIFVVPGIFVEGSFGSGARIENYLVETRSEIRLVQIAAGGLQSVEQEAGGFVIDLPSEDEAHDLHDRDLDGVGVFEYGKFEDRRAAAGAVGGEADALIMKALMKKVVTVAAQGGRTALRAVDFDVLTTIGK